MRLGVLTASYPRWEGDLAGHFVAAHVQWLEAQGHRVDVVRMPRNGLYGAKSLASPSADTGVPDALEAMAAAPLHGRLGALGQWSVHALLATTKQAGATMRLAPQWDAVCAHWLAPSALVGAAAALTRMAKPGRPSMPFLAIAHGGDVHMLRRMRLLRAALALLCRADAKLVWVSPRLRAQALAACGPALRANVAARSIDSPMGIDTARFVRVAEQRRVGAAAAVAVAATNASNDRPALRLLVIARLVPIKGVGDVLLALRQVRRACELVIVGDGPLRETLERQALALAATAPRHRVVFCGSLASAQLDDQLAWADVVVVPSRVGDAEGLVRGEGMPVVALEALAAGVPLIHSGSGGLADLRWLGQTVAEAPQTSLLSSPGIHPIAPERIAQEIEMFQFISSDPPGPTSQIAEALGWSQVGPRLWSHWHG